jgi:hypothetical protein
MTTNVGHMDIRLDWPIQVPTAPIKLLDTSMKPPRTISWEVILREAHFFEEVGTIYIKMIYHIK